ncbi:hypothetical protein [Nostoc sp. DSM 114159]
MSTVPLLKTSDIALPLYLQLSQKFHRHVAANHPQLHHLQNYEVLRDRASRVRFVLRAVNRTRLATFAISFMK